MGKKLKDNEFDCLIIGGGIIGTAILDSLAKYKMKVGLIEQAHDVATGSSGANSGIVHAGYDCKPNTLKALYNVEGNKLMWQVIKELNVPGEQCGSLVLAEEDQKEILTKLQKQGKENGVETEIVAGEQLHQLEKNLTPNIKYGLYAKTAGIVSPYQLAIAYADRAVLNGAKIMTDNRVCALMKGGRDDDEIYFGISAPQGFLRCKFLVNAAGAEGSNINDMLSYEHYETTYRRGEYCLLDASERVNISKVLFPLPTEKGKGILVAPTADGNVIYGPTSTLTTKGDARTTSEGIKEIAEGIKRMYSKPNMANTLKVYAGVRTIIGDDFIVGASQYDKHYFMAIGICSPGLTSAPAIAKYISKAIAIEGKYKVKKEVITQLPQRQRTVTMRPEEATKLIEEDETWGNIVCKCEKVSEHEIVEAIHAPFPAKTVDAIKKRLRTGMGKCQGGFCQPKIIEILSRELNIPIDQVRKDNIGSEVAVSRIKGLPDD